MRREYGVIPEGFEDLHVDPIWGQHHACSEEGWNCVIPTMVGRFLVGGGSDACSKADSFALILSFEG